MKRWSSHQKFASESGRRCVRLEHTLYLGIWIDKSKLDSNRIKKTRLHRISRLRNKLQMSFNIHHDTNASTWACCALELRISYLLTCAHD